MTSNERFDMWVRDRFKEEKVSKKQEKLNGSNIK